MREAVDDAFGNAVGQVLNLRFGARVHERQHGERFPAGPRTLAGGPGNRTCQQRAQRHGQVRRGFKAPCRVALHAARDDGPQLFWRERIEGAQIRHAVVQQVCDNFLRRRSREQPPPTEYLEQEAPEREDVAPAVHSCTRHLFGRHVAERAEHDACRRVRHCRTVRYCRRLEALQREAEVQDLDRTVAGQEDVLRLQVSMDDALAVRRGESVRRRRRDLYGVLPRDRARLHARAERAPFQQFHDGEQQTVHDRELVYGKDARVRQRRDRARLRLEPLTHVGICRDVVRHDLDGDFAAQTHITAAIHVAHPTGAERAEDLVLGEAEAWG